ncbi:unnamed protein product [Urochloa decumbens]|uniref:Uncharacterized protein n=1 Tax=Urochloa decumbens TaxID=240449 RepID=A0ABC8YP51_9POAL
MAATMAMSTNRHRHALLSVLVTMLATSAARQTKTSPDEAAAVGGYRTFIVLLDRRPPAADPTRSAEAVAVVPVPPQRLRRPSYRGAAELQQVASKPGFVAAFPNTMRYLQTTHTPSFLGLLESGAGRVAVWKDSDYGNGAIIGLLDGGIDPRHPSMSDIVFPSEVPERWKGSCPEGFGCNRKLIGAKNMVRHDEPPEDDANGHGTHTATIAAGNFINGVSISGGLANGTASGMAPWAHVAIYKVCRNGSCSDDAILQAMDEAIKDGVDVLSLSTGEPQQVPVVTYDHDVIAIAAYAAMEKGVLVVAAAGNEGPAASSVVNEAPWILTVGAGSVDRSLEGKVRVTSGDPFFGESQVDTRELGPRPGAWYPLLYREEGDRRYCVYPEAERQELRDKIVVCESAPPKVVRGDPIYDAVDKYKAAGAIVIQEKVDGYTFDLIDYEDYPVVQVSYDESQRLKDYASWPAARASIALGGTILGTTPAPVVGSFSGRGPSKRSPGILKPDLLAPGVNILAGVRTDGGQNPFDFKSGTSMATPHVSGLVALFRTLHPHWSPAAIRSAFVTTADFLDNTGNSILDEHRAAAAGAYATGAGHVNVARALDPGLVYDINPELYAVYVCSIHGEAALRRITCDNSRRCPDSITKMNESNLNYPTITVPLRPSPFLVLRTVTNMAPLGPPEVYTIRVDMPPEVRVTVTPGTLNFTAPFQQAAYTLLVSSLGNSPVDGKIYQGSVTLSSSSHTVRTPMLAVVGMDAPRPSTGWEIGLA